MKKYIFLLMAFSALIGQAQSPKKAYKPDPSTLNGKVMFGYQGWFGTPNDGSGLGRWKHWFRQDIPDSAYATFDFWPDMKEYPASALEATRMQYADGKPAKLFSAYHYETVDLHFKWLKEHDLDGVFEQRFVTELKGASSRNHFNGVVRNVKKASEKYERVFCIMYDISGAGEQWKQIIEADWKYLVDSLKVTGSSAYQHHNGLPLVAIWGLGFNHTTFASAAETDSLLDWFHKNPEKKYRASIMGGLNNSWLQQQNEWAPVFNKLDVISPWSVGRYRDHAGADKFRDTAVVPDVAYCNKQNIGYMPVIWPGFSWHNLRNGRTAFNQIPRNGGNFYWHQSYNVLNAGAKMVYIAMYDEVDEGTAMFKLAPVAAAKPVKAVYLTVDQDGEKLPSDWYLQLAGATSNILRGNMKNTVSIPASLKK